MYFADRGAAHAFQLWAVSDDVEHFEAHITAGVVAPSAALPIESSIPPVEGAVEVASRPTSPASCWSWLCSSRLWSWLSCGADVSPRLESLSPAVGFEDASRPGQEFRQLWLFLRPDDVARLSNGRVSPSQAPDIFARWRANVGSARRWGSEASPSVGVAVDGVEVPSFGQ